MTKIRERILRFTGACLAALAVAGCLGSDGGSDTGVISDSITLARLVVNGQPTQLAHLTVPFNQDLQGDAYINVAIDLNGDGQWADYPLGNGSVQPEWVVRNMPAFVTAGQAQNFYISLSDAGARARGNLPLRAIITSARVASLPAAGWDTSMTALAQRSLFITAIADESSTFAPNPFGTVGDAGQSVLRKDVPDRKQPEGTNECVPTATANSLRWLANKNPAAFSGLPADDKVIDELKTDLSFSEDKQGVDPKDILGGKQKFINDHKLPVDSHQVGDANDPVIFGKILAELQKGQDVEIVIKWTITNARHENEIHRHMVTVVGAAQDADGNMSLHFNDPLGSAGVHSQKVDTNGMQPNNPQWLPSCPPEGGMIEYAFADSPVITATPSTPGTTTSTTPVPSTPGTTTSTTTPSTPVTTTPTTPPPPPPAALKLNGNTAFSLTHVQGQTACPTPIGSVALQNTGGTTMNVSVGGGAAWLDLNVASAMVPAGGSVPLSFQFNCSNYVVGTQSATLAIQASDSASGASAGQATLSISLTVQ